MESYILFITAPPIPEKISWAEFKNRKTFTITIKNSQ